MVKNINPKKNPTNPQKNMAHLVKDIALLLTIFFAANQRKKGVKGEKNTTSPYGELIIFGKNNWRQ